VSIRLSPDGMYYWDGAQWLTTLSADGRFRWDGAAWRPVSGTGLVASPYAARTPTRVATSWTRPLQYGVIGWYLLSSALFLSLPFWMSGWLTDVMKQSINESIQRQAQLYPSASPLPPDVATSITDLTTTTVTFVLWFAVAFGLALSVLAIVGAVKRWVWLYYAVLVLLGLGLLDLPVTLINLATGGSVTSAASGVTITLPSWFLWATTISYIPAVGLFAFMLIAIVRRGPWGMTRPPA
jgi:hypothetical protein